MREFGLFKYIQYGLMTIIVSGCDASREYSELDISGKNLENINASCVADLSSHKGKAFYEQELGGTTCVSCHGDMGSNGSVEINFSNYSGVDALELLATRNSNTMPPSAPSACTGSDDGDCAKEVGDYLLKLQACVVEPSDENQIPIADAGSDQTVEPGSDVILDASASSDDGALIYQWTQDIKAAETQVTINNASSSAANFTASSLELGETLYFIVTVTDEGGLSQQDSVIVSVLDTKVIGNTRPQVNAGTDQTVSAGEIVTLMAMASDADNDALSYFWQVMSGDETLTLNSNDLINSGFTAPDYREETELIIRVTVTDDPGDSAFDTLTITVAPAVVDCGILNSHAGKNNYEVQCQSCHGDINQGGAGGIIDISNGFSNLISNTISSMPPSNISSCSGGEEGDCAFEAIDYVFDMAACGLEANELPSANAGPDQTVNSSNAVTLNGLASADEDGEISTYQWQQISGDSVSLSAEDVAKPTFTAPESADGQTLIFELTVTDNDGATSQDSVSIFVNAQGNDNTAPIVDAGINQTVQAQDSVTLLATASDNDGTIASVLWSIQSGASGLLINDADQLSASFTAPKYAQDTDIIFVMTVIDEDGAKSSDTVTISVKQYIGDGTCAELNFHAGYSDYTEHCAGCHGASNDGGFGGVIDLSKSLTELISKTHSDMPTSNTALCIGDSAGDCAFETIDYLVELEACAPAAGAFANQTFNKLPALKHLNKLTHSLAGRSPTTVEISAVQADGESAIESVVDDLLEEDAFYARLKEIYNDMFLMYARELAGNTGTRLDRMYDDSGWTTEQWPDDKTKRKWASNGSAQSFTQDIVQLINYLTRQDKDYRELLTAQYVMANRYGALYMGASDSDLAQFTAVYTEQDVADGNVDTDLYPYAQDLVADGKYALNYDPQEFHPIMAPGKVTAGALTSETWYGRFLDTSTNRNRHRAYQIFLQYMDMDMLGVTNVRGDDATDNDGVPVMENSSCVTCHSIMDPVASLLEGWGYVNDNFTGTYDATRTFADTQAFQAGFKGACVVLPGTDTTPSKWPIDGVTCSTYAGDELVDGVPNPMLWLGKQLVQEDGFVSATVKRLFEGLFGQVPVRIASFDRVNASESLLALEAIQKDYFSYWGQAFINSGYKMKVLIKAMVTSDYYAPESLKIASLAQDDLGAVNLKTPEMIRRSFLEHFDDEWNFRDKYYFWGISGGDLAYGTYVLYYGGIEHEDVIVRTKDIESIKVAMHSKIGSQATCEGVYLDFEKETSERRLFPFIEIGEIDEGKVNQNIRHLLLTLHGRDLDEDDEEVLELVNYWNEFRSIGEDSGASSYYSCIEDGPNKIGFTDTTYSLQAWHTLVSALIDDFDYLFE